MMCCFRVVEWPWGNVNLHLSSCIICCKSLKVRYYFIYVIMQKLSQKITNQQLHLINKFSRGIS
jgi:hypothetical protein